MFKSFPMKRELLIKQGAYCELDGAPLGLHHTMEELRQWCLGLSKNASEEIHHYKVTIRAEPVIKPRRCSECGKWLDAPMLHWEDE